MKTAPVIAAPFSSHLDRGDFSVGDADRHDAHGGGLRLAEQVFLRGNDLPGRWRGRERFVVLETGFGHGHNFLATWAAWRDDPQRCERLHFIAIEAHPLTAADMALAHGRSALPRLTAELLAAWPVLTCNLHRLDFEGGRVQLLLAFGEVTTWLPEVVASVDAFYLDGFASEREPALWQPRVFKALGRLARFGATLATTTSAPAVQAGLTTSGFELMAASGGTDAPALTLARFAPAFTPRLAPARLRGAAAGERHALVVGAGLAGCAVACALAEQGWHSTLFETLPAIASAASGNRAGIFHGVVNPHDGAHARFNRAAALQARRAVQRAIEQHGVEGQVCGVLRLETVASQAAMAARLAALGLPTDYVRAVSAAEASHLAGVPLAAPAWFYPGGGWVSPRALAASFLLRADSHVNLQSAVRVAGLRRSHTGWQLLDGAGRVLGEAPVVVLANGCAATELLGGASWPLHSVRGQTTEMLASTAGLHLPRRPITGEGYVLPTLPGGMALFGATAQADDADPALRVDDHRHNLARLARLTGSAPAVDCAALDGRVGWRCVAEDRLPLIGAVPDWLASRQPGRRLDQPRFVPREPGLFVFTALASRGITWAALGAQTLASVISGAPCPLEASLLDAVDAARFVSRAARRQQPR